MMKFLRVLAVSAIAVTCGAVSWSLADYLATQPGTGTTFFAGTIGGKQVPGFLACDATVAGQCVAVNGSGQITIANSSFAATQSGAWSVSVTGTTTVSGSVLVNPGNIPNATPWLMTINQGGNSAVVKAGNTAAVTDNGLVVADANVVSAINAATPTGANVIGFVTNDPCSSINSGSKTSKAITQSGSASIITGTAAKKTYICSLLFNISDGESISIVEGTTVSTPCDTGGFALVGSTAVSSGMSLAANQGAAYGNGAATVIYATNANADNVCILQSGSGRLAGSVSYVQQ